MRMLTTVADAVADALVWSLRDGAADPSIHGTAKNPRCTKCQAPLIRNKRRRGKWPNLHHMDFKDCEKYRQKQHANAASAADDLLAAAAPPASASSYAQNPLMPDKDFFATHWQRLHTPVPLEKYLPYTNPANSLVIECHDAAAFYGGRSPDASAEILQQPRSSDAAAAAAADCPAARSSNDRPATLLRCSPHASATPEHARARPAAVAVVHRGMRFPIAVALPVARAPVAPCKLSSAARRPLASTSQLVARQILLGKRQRKAQRAHRATAGGNSRPQMQKLLVVRRTLRKPVLQLDLRKPHHVSALLSGSALRGAEPEWIIAAHRNAAAQKASGGSVSFLARGGESMVFRVNIPPRNGLPLLDCVAKCFFHQKACENERIMSEHLRANCAAAPFTREDVRYELPGDVCIQLQNHFRGHIRSLSPTDRAHVAALLTPVVAAPLVMPSRFMIRRLVELKSVVQFKTPPLLYRFYEGSLADAVQSTRRPECRARLFGDPFSVQRCCELVLQCLRGLAAHHNAGVLHGDIKPANILYSQSTSTPPALHIALADYGHSLHTQGGKKERSWRRGTQGFRAPEVFGPDEVEYSAASDIFGMGCALLDVIAGHTPAAAAVTPTEPERSHTPERLARAYPAHLLSQLLFKMINDDPAARPNMQQCLANVLACN